MFLLNCITLKIILVETYYYGIRQKKYHKILRKILSSIQVCFNSHTGLLDGIYKIYCASRSIFKNEFYKK